jgi:hypothetical protein
VNVTPLGSAAPVRTIDGIGVPIVVTVNVPATPTVKVVVAALVIVGAGPALTTRVKLWTAFGRFPFEAVNVRA